VRLLKVGPMYEKVVLIGGFVLLLLMTFWMVRGVSRMGDAAYERQDAYFTQRMRIADQQLREIAKRLGAEYVPGIVEWKQFATPHQLMASEMGPPNSIGEGGSVVRKAIDGYTIEVTYGVQPLVPHERGAPTSWDVLVPRFTVTAAKPRRPLDRFDVYWSSDDEALGATGRAVDKALSGALSFVGRTLLPMPPDVERAHATLTMDASSIWCGKDRIEATGRPLPRAQGETRELGQGDFEVESMLKMVERTLALVRTLENA
jgi:hypothetical protein